MKRWFLDRSSRRYLPTSNDKREEPSFHFDVLIVVYSGPRVRKTWHHVLTHRSCLHLSLGLHRVGNLFRFSGDAPAGDIVLGHGVTCFDNGYCNGEHGWIRRLPQVRVFRQVLQAG